MFDLLEATLTLPLFLADAVFSGIYTGGLLESRLSRTITLILWGSIYFCSEAVIFKGLIDLGDLERILLNLSVLLILQVLLFERDYKKWIFAALSFTVGKELCKNIISVTYYLISGVSGSFVEKMISDADDMSLEKANLILEVSLIIQSAISAGIYVGLLYSYLKLLSRKYVYKDYEPSFLENVFLLLPCVTGLSVSVTMHIVILKINEKLSLLIYDQVPEVLIWLIGIYILLLGSAIASMILFQYLIERNEERRKQVILENQIVQLHREIEDIEAIYSDLRGLKHDMRNHINSIMQYVKSSGDKGGDIYEYIGELEDTINKLDFSAKSGNPITDIIIFERKQEAKNYDIDFDVDFVMPDSGHIDIYDIAIILNNALDNAFEACRELSGVREICLKSYLKGTLFFIEVENSFEGNIIFDRDTELPITNKTDKHLHGIGMSNIQKCARKYMGDLDIEISSCGERKKFRLTVMMGSKILPQ